MTAPVTFVTGLPGNGKTLYSICMVKEWAEKEKRTVYYHGIEILDKEALPWIEFADATTWHTLPVGSIIVIDEAHKVFPLRPQGSKVPPHVEAIAELRHQGHNLVLITQHPMEVDSAIRRRCGRHLHAVRRFGMQACALFEWSRCVDNCDKTRKDAIQHEWVYRKEAYAWYKSAEVHTIKRRLPKKLVILAVAPLLVCVAIWYVWSIFSGQRNATAEATKQEGTSQASAGPQQRPQQAPGAPMTRQEWLDRYRPRVSGLEYTAPAYDEVTKPVRAPYPAACVQSAKRCQCYSQQGTRLAVPDELCKGISEGGFFMAWDERTGQRVDQVPATKPQPVADQVEAGHIELTPGYQPQRKPFQASQSDQVEQDPARPRANRTQGG